MLKFKLEYEFTVYREPTACVRAIQAAAPFLFEDIKKQIFQEHGVVVDFIVSSKLQQIK